MLENLQSEAQPSMASLVSGIISDAQHLVRDEIALARREIQEEVNKAKVAAISFGVGVAVAVLGGLMLCFMLAHLLNWGFNLPEWVGFGIVALVFLTVSAIMFFTAMTKVKQIDLMPRQTVETMKENVQWIKNQT